MNGKAKRIGLGITVILPTIVVLFCCMTLIQYNMRRAAEFPTYTPQNIQEICRLFPTQKQAFCTDLSGQNAIQLNETIKELFPAGQATYDDVIAHFGSLPSSWWSSYECPSNAAGRQLDNCPPPQFCEKADWYSCQFSSESDNIPSISVSFDMTTGLVTQILVETPSDS